ncbi:hypothetical protein FRB93_004203 [Tulasnella sp. JGI-2019a]|nr:hypothetical protein FRB93_004203 [Tulasnella sp. JGI-2019a]
MGSLNLALIFSFLVSTIIVPSHAFMLIPRGVDNSAPRVTIPLSFIGSSAYSAGVHMGTPPQHFAFQLASTVAYTIVAGPDCTGCSSNASAPLYNPSNSSSFQPQTPVGSVTQQPIAVAVNGKDILGTLATENCAFQRSNGTWWTYPKQPIMVASQATNGSALSGSGVVGLGMTAAANRSDSFIGQFLDQNPALTNFTLGVALNSPNPGADTSPPAATTEEGMVAGDSSGGAMHVHHPDPSYFKPPMVNVPVASAMEQSSFGTTPTQLGSFDWTVQTAGWEFSSGGGGGASGVIDGGNGTFATIEMAYPYILLTNADATKIFNSISGAQQYSVASTATTSTGASVFDDAQAVSWSIPCSKVTKMTISFTFNGVTISVQSNALYTTIGGVCVSNIKGWADPNRTTFILGSTFLSSAYIVYTSFPDPSQSNQIGLANRQFVASGSNNTGVIVGGVLGGLALILLIVFVILLIVRRQRHEAPSSAYLTTGMGMGMSEGNTYSDKSGGSRSIFGMFSKKAATNDDNMMMAADPWAPPPRNGRDSDVRSVEHAYGGNHNNVTVAPWTPSEASEKAFLSPTRLSFDSRQQPERRQSQTSFTFTTVMTPPPPSDAVGAYEVQRASEQQQLYAQQQRLSTGYSPVPTSSSAGHYGPVIWVERPGQ